MREGADLAMQQAGVPLLQRKLTLLSHAASLVSFSGSEGRARPWALVSTVTF